MKTDRKRREEEEEGSGEQSFSPECDRRSSEGKKERRGYSYSNSTMARGYLSLLPLAALFGACLAITVSDSTNDAAPAHSEAVTEATHNIKVRIEEEERQSRSGQLGFFP